MDARLPLVRQMRAPPPLLSRRSRPVCLALGVDACVLGFDNGAVAAWSVGADGDEWVVEGSLGMEGGADPRWTIAALEGSGGDGCPVDALEILPASTTEHASGAVAVAHGGIEGKFAPRPARVGILCLATGRELRVLDLPMAWPDGGICPVARVVAVGGEGGVAAVSAARVFRTGEGVEGFQGSFATLAVWGPASASPCAVVQAGPKHRALLEASGAAEERRHPERPILAPFAGLAAEERAAGLETGSEATVTLVLSAAHVTFSPADGALHLSFQEWHLVKICPVSGGGGGILRPAKAVELPSLRLGARSEIDVLRAEAGVEGVSAPGAATAERAAPVVAVWGRRCAATWSGCQPRAAAWCLPGGETAGNEEEEGSKQRRTSAALERCMAGVTRRAAALLPAGSTRKWLVVMSYDHATFRDDARLFVVAAVEDPCARDADTADSSFRNGMDIPEKAPAEMEPCPICLDDPGSTGQDATGTVDVDAVKLSEYDLMNPAPFSPGSGTRRDTKKNEAGVDVLSVPCCSRAFCRGCLRDYLVAFPRGGCPHCRDVHTFNSLAPSLGVSTGLDGWAEPLPWVEVSLDFPSLPRALQAPRAPRASSGEASSLASSLKDQSFLRGIGLTDEASDASVMGRVERGRAEGDGGDGGYGDAGFVPAAPSYVGHVSGPQGEDNTLVPTERTTVAVDDVFGRLAVLTKSGAAVLDLREETLEALFRESRHANS